MGDRVTHYFGDDCPGGHYDQPEARITTRPDCSRDVEYVIVHHPDDAEAAAKLADRYDSVDVRPNKYVSRGKVLVLDYAFIGGG